MSLIENEMPEFVHSPSSYGMSLMEAYVINGGICH